jgi:hypothetical protein
MFASVKSGPLGRIGLVAAILVGASLTGSRALAVDGGPPVFSLYHPYSISKALDEKAVQDDMSLSPQQVKNVTAALERVRKRHIEDSGKAFKAPAADRKKMVDDQLDQTTRDMFNALATVLRPEQMKRLKQILHQEKGFALIEQPDIRALMNISDEQFRSLKNIQEGLKNDLIEQVKAGKVARADASRYNQLLLKAISPKVQEALSAEQRKMLKELLGVRLVR